MNQYPIPDPAWDYAELWHYLFSFESEPPRKLVDFILCQEEATDETDGQIYIIARNTLRPEILEGLINRLPKGILPF